MSSRCTWGVGSRRPGSSARRLPGRATGRARSNHPQWERRSKLAPLRRPGASASRRSQQDGPMAWAPTYMDIRTPATPACVRARRPNDNPVVRDAVRRPLHPSSPQTAGRRSRPTAVARSDRAGARLPDAPRSNSTQLPASRSAFSSARSAGRRKCTAPLLTHSKGSDPVASLPERWYAPRAGGGDPPGGPRGRSRRGPPVSPWTVSRSPGGWRSCCR